MQIRFTRPNKKVVISAKTLHLCSSGLAFLVGFLLIFGYNKIEITLLSIIVGAVCAFSGATGVYGYFSNDPYRIAFQSDFALGVFDIIFGVMLIVRPTNLSTLLPCAIAVITLLDAGNKAQMSIEGKQFGISKWFLVLTSSAIEAIVGSILLVQAGRQQPNVMLLAGISFACVGAINFWTTMYTVTIKEIKKEI